MEVLLLCYRGEPIRRIPLGERPLEVGSGAGCDIVVADPTLRGRHCLLVGQHGSVVVHELGDDASRTRPLAVGESLRLGTHHTILRAGETQARVDGRGGRTEPLESVRVDDALSLVVGRDPEGRRIRLGPSPITVGSTADCDIQIHDRAVSARHCRFEPSPGGLRVRDLDSRNGTYLDGVAVALATLGRGSRVRIGRTDIRLVGRDTPGSSPLPRMVARSEAMRSVLDQIERCARLPWTTLITGESGAGKEGVARGLHELGVRPDGPFVEVNAGGMPASLIESELFGHERGAFTGATAARRGVFEQADGGTLFLDEIGELPLELQARLLRVIETWQIRRVGSERSIPVNVRLVCATHRNLMRMVHAGTFRQDLYYRLAQIAIHVPPLRERPDDIAALAEHFIEDLGRELGPRVLSSDAVARLGTYSWPGNARELRTVIRRAGLHASSRMITAKEIASALESMGVDRELDACGLEAALAQHDGNLTAAARHLGIPRTTLRDRLRKATEASSDEDAS